MHALPHRSLMFSAVVLVTAGMPYPDPPPFKLDSAYYQCKAVPSRSCASHFNMAEGDTWYARSPNPRGLNMSHSLEEFLDFSWLLEMDNYCSKMLRTLLCLHYFPPCSPNSSPAVLVQPCREVCREAAEACLPIARALRGDSIIIPHHLNCANFPDYENRRSSRYYHHEGRADNSPVGLLRPNTVLACPNASIHVEFSPPAGKQVYEVLEGSGVLEVCLSLANVGSFNGNETLDIPVTIHLSTVQRNYTTHEIATPNVDYTPVTTTLVFPVGSSKWHQLCASVSIITNGDIDSDRAFGLRADILSPTSASFGGSTHSSTGTIDAIIVDDDGIHVAFDLPEGRTLIESNEDMGRAEVCLELVSDYQAVLSTPVSVTLHPIQSTSTIFVRAEPELDYSVDTVNLEFPTGSGVGHTQCANISISSDGLVEADESFTVHATIDSPISIRFVTNLQQSDSVNVIIRDDDECTIPAGQCRRNCDMRDNASKGIFRHNCFEYAAKVQIIRERNLQGCSALDVTVIHCWELQPGACVANGTRLSLPFCQNCQTNVTEGGEYLVAGLHNAGVGMFLPNYKRAGLVAEWNDRRYSSMGDWVLFGIEHRTADSDCDG